MCILGREPMLTQLLCTRKGISLASSSRGRRLPSRNDAAHDHVQNRNEKQIQRGCGNLSIHEPDLAVDVVLQSAQCLRAQSSKQRYRHGQQHDKHVALILRDKRQLNHHRAQREKNQRLSAGLDFYAIREASWPLTVASCLSGSICSSGVPAVTWSPDFTRILVIYPPT
jgi:hypothetical protein